MKSFSPRVSKEIHHKIKEEAYVARKPISYVVAARLTKFLDDMPQSLDQAKSQCDAYLIPDSSISFLLNDTLALRLRKQLNARMKVSSFMGLCLSID